MALSKDQIRDTYPLPVYNYKVTVQDDDDAPTISFSEVSGLSMEYKPVTYRHGLSFVLGFNIIPGMPEPIKLTLKKGLVKGNDFLLRWIDESNNEPLIGSSKRDVVIDLCDETGTAVVRWTVLGALPTKLDAPGFNAESNEVAIESLELIAHGLKVEHEPA